MEGETRKGLLLRDHEMKDVGYETRNRRRKLSGSNGEHFLWQVSDSLVTRVTSSQRERQVPKYIRLA